MCPSGFEETFPEFVRNLQGFCPSSVWYMLDQMVGFVSNIRKLEVMIEKRKVWKVWYVHLSFSCVRVLLEVVVWGHLMVAFGRYHGRAEYGDVLFLQKLWWLQGSGNLNLCVYFWFKSYFGLFTRLENSFLPVKQKFQYL